MEPMMECLLAKIDARVDANTKAVQQKMDATQERMVANTKAMQEKMDASQERMNTDTKAMQERMERQIGSLVSIMEAARKTNRDEIKQEIRAGQEHIKEIMETQFGSLADKLDGWQK
jgi:DNA relaxase NicK